MRSFRLLAQIAAAISFVAIASPARAQESANSSAADDETPIESMRKARSYFEYGDYASASKLLSRLIDTASFETGELRTEAYRLLGLSDFYQGKKGEAYRAFLEVLYLNPDLELDPFYVPPTAVSFFEQVKKEAEPRLAPIRAQRRAEEEARRKIALEEARARRAHELEEEQRRLALVSPTIERRVVQREFWVSLLPFGVGQIQNGDRSLGIALATSETIAGATSAGSALLIESLRDDSTGKFSSGVYPLAQRLNVAKWIGAGLFYALWVAGAIHAAVRYEPETLLPDRVASPGGMARPPQESLPTPTLPPYLELPPQDPKKSPAPPSAPEILPPPVPSGAKNQSQQR